MLTPNSAAKRANVSRRTIMRAIQNQELEARRGNSSWEIDPDALDEWMDRAHAQAQETTPTDAHAKDIELAALKAEVVHLREDRDRWRELATRPRGIAGWIWAWRTSGTVVQ